MSFTLKMTFSGLCMFVRHANSAADDRIHVLFVDAGSHHHHRHDMVQRFDSRFLGGGTAPGTITDRVLAKHLIEIPRNVVTDARPVILPSALHALTNHPAHTKVPAATVKAAVPVPGLGARLSLPPLGAITVGECEEFELAGATIKLTNSLTWEIKEINLLSLPLKTWSKHPAAPTVADLHPDATGVIEVAFLDLPPNELAIPPIATPAPAPGSVLPHFALFFGLIPSSSAVPLVYKGPCSAATEPGNLAVGIHPRTCMLIGGEYA